MIEIANNLFLIRVIVNQKDILPHRSTVQIFCYKALHEELLKNIFRASRTLHFSYQMLRSMRNNLYIG